MNQLVVLHRRRNFTEILNVSFEYLVRHYRTLLTPMLVVASIMSLLVSIATRVFQMGLLVRARTTISMPTGRSSYWSLMAPIVTPSYWILLGLSLLSGVLVSMIVYSHVLSYEENPDEPITVGSVMSWFEAKWFRVVPVALVSGLLVMTGLLLFLIPGIYCAVALSLITFVVMREDLGLVSAIRRCFALIVGNWWLTLGVILIMWVISFVVHTGTNAIALAALGRTYLANPIIQVITSTVMGVFGALLSAPLYLALAFQYYNLLERKESIGLLNQVEAIGIAPDRQPHPADE